jgi:8-oxo-dGTP diphosphatase
MPGSTIDQTMPPRRGVVAVIVQESRLLVIRRSQQVVAPGAYCFPGGHVEDGETEPDALVREIQEELGAIIRPVRSLWTSITPWNVHLSWWLAVAETESAWEINPQEVESVHWLTLAEIQSLPGLLSSNHEFLQAVSAGDIALQVL